MNEATAAPIVWITPEMQAFANKLIAQVKKTRGELEAKVEERSRYINVSWPHGCSVEVHGHVRNEGNGIWVRIDGARSEEQTSQGNGDSPPKVATVSKRVCELIRRQEEREAHHAARVASRKSVRARVKAMLPEMALMKGDGYYEYGLPTKHGTIHLKAENSGKATVHINLHATLEPEDAARLMLALQAAIGTKDPTP